MWAGIGFIGVIMARGRCSSSMPACPVVCSKAPAPCDTPRRWRLRPWCSSALHRLQRVRCTERVRRAVREPVAGERCCWRSCCKWRGVRTVSATRVCDRELEFRRLAALRGSGKLRAVAARVEQNRHTRDGPHVIARRASESVTSPLEEGTWPFRTVAVTGPHVRVERASYFFTSLNSSGL